MLIGLGRQQGLSSLSLRWYPKHLSPHLPVRPLRLQSFMTHPAVSSGAVPIPDLASQQVPRLQKEKKPKAVIASSFPLELQPPPDFFDHRVKIFQDLKAEYDAFLRAQPRREITITLPDGAERKGTSWETSPMDIAKDISKSLSEKLVIAKVPIPPSHD
ncbi:hypothetical protein BC826DRAFT_357661 [Russula brevipes]|nr:hypothetical protein BC826DRAFT_357661 [Russula brevipes]